MACDNYYLKPYFWLLILTIILFVIFIVIIESNQSFTSSGVLTTATWVLLLFVILLFITSLLWYYYDSLKPCDISKNVKTITYSIESPIIENTPVLQPHCSLDELYEEPKISYIDEEYIPLSALNPFK